MLNDQHPLKNKILLLFYNSLLASSIVKVRLLNFIRDMEYLPRIFAGIEEVKQSKGRQERRII
jgi:hypothetical protein